MKRLAALLCVTGFGLCCGQGPSSPPQEPVPGSGILWTTGHETGDLSDWYEDQGGGVFNTGTGRVSVTNEVAHTGSYAVKMEVWGIDESEQACRLFRWGERLTEGYYSCWYMFPVLPQVEGWLNIFQFKKRNGSDPDETTYPTWYNEVKPHPEGIILTLTQWNRAWNLPGNIHDAPPILAGQWFHVEWYYKDGVEDGALRVWVDGKLVWRMDNVDTRGGSPLIQWAPSLYGTEVTPAHLVLFIDDAAISTRRIGPAAD